MRASFKRYQYYSQYTVSIGTLSAKREHEVAKHTGRHSAVVLARYFAAVDSEDDEDSGGSYAVGLSDSFEGDIDKSNSSHTDLTSISHTATKEDDSSTVVATKNMKSQVRHHLDWVEESWKQISLFTESEPFLSYMIHYLHRNGNYKVFVYILTILLKITLKRI